MPWKGRKVPWNPDAASTELQCWSKMLVLVYSAFLPAFPPKVDFCLICPMKNVSEVLEYPGGLSHTWNVLQCFFGEQWFPPLSPSINTFLIWFFFLWTWKKLKNKKLTHFLQVFLLLFLDYFPPFFWLACFKGSSKSPKSSLFVQFVFLWTDGQTGL